MPDNSSINSKTNAASSASSGIPKRPTWPTWVSTRCSIAGRRARVSLLPTARRSRVSRDGLCGGRVQRRIARAAARADRHRARSLLDGRREQTDQRAADSHRLRSRPDCDLPQRQPRQRQRAARRARAPGFDLPVKQRHRSRAAPLRALEGRQRRRTRHRFGLADSRRVFAPDDDEGSADRRARSPRLPPARARPAGRCVCRLFGNVRDGSHRRHLRTRHRAG